MSAEIEDKIGEINHNLYMIRNEIEQCRKQLKSLINTETKLVNKLISLEWEIENK